jgi:hypothetical protein
LINRVVFVLSFVLPMVIP